MRLVILKLVTLTFLAMLSAPSLWAQTNGHAVAGAERFVGETLKYDGNINKSLFRGISIAELSFLTTAVPGTNNVLIKSEAVSKGTLLKLFRYSFLQQYNSTVDGATFRILKTGKHDVQKQRVRDSEAVFDYSQKRVIFVETDPRDPTRPPRRIASEIGDQMYDMITAIYATRAMPLAVGKRFEFPVSDSGLVYTVPIVVTGREIQKSVAGKVACFIVEPEIFGPNRLIEQKGRMVIWITDDDRRIPVRAQMHTTYGRIDIKLKSIEQRR
ncbi:MAG: DUF3108 domain-containing protein [Pyrinomonadaceae bacterium]